MNRRGFLAGLLFAPAIIRTPGLLMPVKPPVTFDLFNFMAGQLFEIISEEVSLDLVTYGRTVYQVGTDGLARRIPMGSFLAPE